MLLFMAEASDMNDQEVRLRDLISQLERGQISTADAAAQVRTLRFPKPASKTAYQTMEADAAGDPAIPVKGSFFVVSQAFTAGRITREQYEALAKAAAEAMKGSQGNAAGSPSPVPGQAPGQAEDQLA